MKVRSLVPVFVNRFDGHGNHGDSGPGAGNQHLHFIFVPVALDFRHKRQFLPAECAQAGLGVRQPLAVQQPEYRGRDPVSRPGFGRNVRQVEIPASQVQGFPSVRHLFRQADTVAHGMLSVRIGGDHRTPGIRQFKDMAVSGLQRDALSAVHLMPEHRGVRYLRHLPENRLIVFSAAVVHDHDQSESALLQFPDIGRQPFVRLQRRNQDHRIQDRLVGFIHMQVLSPFYNCLPRRLPPMSKAIASFTYPVSQNCSSFITRRSVTRWSGRISWL